MIMQPQSFADRGSEESGEAHRVCSRKMPVPALTECPAEAPGRIVSAFLTKVTRNEKTSQNRVPC